MEKGLKERFVEKWERHFPGASLPICFFYTDDELQGAPVTPHPGMRCLIRELGRVRAGESLSFAVNTVGCAGGRYFLGFRPAPATRLQLFPFMRHPRATGGGTL